MIIKLQHQPSGGREWVAEITGRDPKYTFKRTFIAPVAGQWSSSGKTGTTAFELEEGKVYQINEPWKDRRFVTIENGELRELSAENALSILDQRQ